MVQPLPPLETYQTNLQQHIQARNNLIKALTAKLEEFDFMRCDQWRDGYSANHCDWCRWSTDIHTENTIITMLEHLIEHYDDPPPAWLVELENTLNEMGNVYA